ncbi:MAG: integrase [Anaerolineaceae bacterium]|nr:integrase [Anaerolineaceae bacterium]
MLTVKEWEQIRRAFYIEGKNINEIARETGRAWRTVKKMVESEQPPRYTKRQKRQAHKLGPYQKRIRQLLAQNKTLPRKQRWTSPTILLEIQKEGYSGAASTVRHFVAQVRKEQKAVVRQKTQVFLPLEFDPGTDAQVDWGEAAVIMKGQQIIVQLFLMKLSYSRRTFIMAFPSQKQESLWLGHVKAFEFFGGVPRRISYDNLKTAVQTVLKGKKRIEQQAFYHFRGVYLFESHFCTPGAGHEKGLVEHSVGYYRRHFLVPLPEVESYAELNNYLLERCLAEDERQVQGQPATIGAMWQTEKAALRALPTHPFDCCQTVPVRLNRYSQVQVETNRYSVPTDQGQLQMMAKLYPFTIEIYATGESEPVTVHARCYDKEQEIIDPHHYLPLIRQNPGAFLHAKPVRRWREQWAAVYEQLLAQLQQKWSDGRGVREFVQILYLHRQHSAEELTAAIEKAIDHRCAHLDGVKLWLTQLNQPDPTFSAVDLGHNHQLQGIGQQPLQLAMYDSLVGGHS